VLGVSARTHRRPSPPPARPPDGRPPPAARPPLRPPPPPQRPPRLQQPPTPLHPRIEGGFPPRPPPGRHTPPAPHPPPPPPPPPGAPRDGIHRHCSSPSSLAHHPAFSPPPSPPINRPHVQRPRRSPPVAGAQSASASPNRCRARPHRPQSGPNAAFPSSDAVATCIPSRRPYFEQPTPSGLRISTLAWPNSTAEP